jgi:hypothetical protein
VPIGVRYACFVHVVSFFSTPWRVLMLRLEETEGIREYSYCTIEYAATDSRQGLVLHSLTVARVGGLTTPHRKLSACYEVIYGGSEWSGFFGTTEPTESDMRYGTWNFSILYRPGSLVTVGLHHHDNYSKIQVSQI